MADRGGIKTGALLTNRLRIYNYKLQTSNSISYKRKQSECISGIFHDIDKYHFLCHDKEEVSEGDFPCAVLIHVTNHLLDLLFLWFKPQSSHCNLSH